MSTKQRQIGVTFTKKNVDLLKWATDEAERQKRPLSWIGQDAFATLRLFGSLEAAQACQRQRDAYAAFVAGELTREQLEVALK